MTDPRRLVLVAALAITGAGVDSAQAPVKGQPGFRVRSDFSAPLNSDKGWTGAINEDVTIQADRPFRIRFELEGAAGSAGSHQFRLQYRRNTGDWTEVEAHDFPKPDSDGARTPRVSAVSCAAYRNGAATTNLLAGSSDGTSSSSSSPRAAFSARTIAAGGSPRDFKSARSWARGFEAMCIPAGTACGSTATSTTQDPSAGQA